ncbi:hypothetical protein ACLI4Q_19995 [Natrialbaceae archaeon A-CW1-1]
MRFKLVPEAPDSLAYVETVQQAVPLVPGTEDDCCARIMRRTDIEPRDEARTWLTFLRALELAEEGSSGYHRVRTEPGLSTMREAFQKRVYGVDRILALLDDEPQTADEVFESFREDIPEYERNKHHTRLREVWGERVRRILEWAVRFDLAERTSDGYVRR